MTKKSLGRMRRDEAKKEVLNSSVWDDVLVISWRCRQLLQSHVGLNEMVKCKELMDLVADPKTLWQNITIMTGDLRQMQLELNGLYNMHSTRTGNPTDVDDGALAIDIHEKYLVWDQKHNSVVQPIATHILEQLSVAEGILAEKNPELVAQLRANVSAAMRNVLGGQEMVPSKNVTPAQDPSVISDAVIKG